VVVDLDLVPLGEHFNRGVFDTEHEDEIKDTDPEMIEGDEKEVVGDEEDKVDETEGGLKA